MRKKIKLTATIYAVICTLTAIVFLFTNRTAALIAALCLVFPIAVALFIYLLNETVKKTSGYKATIPDTSAYPTNEWYRNHLERNFDIINIGSSSAKCAFNYEGLPIKAFNWGERPQSLENGFKILKTYFSILKRDGIVLIPLGPLSGLDVEGKWGAKANDKYYYLLPPALIDNYFSIAMRRKYPIVFNPVDSAKYLIKQAIRRTKENNGQHMEDTFQDDSEKWIKSWMEEFSIDSFDAPISETNKTGQNKRIALLEQIIAFCIERNLRPAILIPPIHKSLAEKFPPAFRENYIYNFVHNANKQNVPFFNYIDDERFDDEKYFRNSFLLNEEGAKKFTKIVLNDINLL